MSKAKNQFLSTAQAAEEYDCHRSYIAAEINRGNLRAYKATRAYTILREDFEAWKAEKQAKKQTK